MKTTKKTRGSIFVLLITILSSTSCITTSEMRFMQVELMQPGRVTMSSEIDTIAVFKRDPKLLDTVQFKYYVESFKNSRVDTAIHNRDLSLKCVKSFIGHLEQEGYFLKVIDYSDSDMKNLFTESDSVHRYRELINQLKVDACIFLDRFELSDILIDHERYYPKYYFVDDFPEFEGSTALETIHSTLLWTVAIKGDSSIYYCRHPERVYYGNSVDSAFFGNDANHKLMLENTAEYLGKAFGEIILPSWKKVERLYCRSKNDKMMMAEKYLLEGDYKKAAEIYKPQTKHKNRNIAAKAQFNMALACEMEGEMEAAHDWLVKSYSVFGWNEDHKMNCRQYIKTLALRKKEFERLNVQVRGQLD